MEKITTLKKEHQDNVKLANKINFYKDEIQILKKSLVDLSKEFNKQNDLKELVRLQNLLKIQEKNAKNISQAIRNDEKIIDKNHSIGCDEGMKQRSKGDLTLIRIRKEFQRDPKSCQGVLGTLSCAFE